MTIAKGMSNVRAEREIVMQGFREQVEVLEQSLHVREATIKAELYDIITDYTISEDEKPSLKSPYLTVLGDLEEKHIRIRRSIFIGLYSFWEISLMNISNNTKFNSRIPVGETHPGQAKKNLNRKKERSGTTDYINKIYGDNIPESLNIINYNIKELRNYMVHGSMDERRENAIKALIISTPELHIIGTDNDYYFIDYSGIKCLLDMFERELNNAECKINSMIK